ncbi:MAG: HAD hydrolase-like protein, partial [Pseudomonadota bacterium]
MKNNFIRPSAIIFDFDDTLIDARPAVHKALKATLKKFDISDNIITEKNIDTNKSLRDYFHHIFANNIIEARDSYYDYYTEFSKDLKQLEMAEDVLKFLRKQDVFTAIVSNKGGKRLR